MPASAQYELDETSVHVGAGLRMLNSADLRMLGAGAHAQFAYTHYPCGKPWAIEGRAGFHFGRVQTGDGSLLTGEAASGATSLLWGGGEIAAAFKVRLHDYHRPREFAFLLGPKVLFPFLGRYKSGLSSGALSARDITTNVVAPAAFFAVQFRKPAPDKKSWFIEPGFEFTPTPLFRREDGPQLSAFYVYLGFGFAFWDQRG